MNAAADGELTLAFSLTAVERLASPEDAFADARTWSRYVGIVSKEPRAAERYSREHGIQQDFFTGERDKAASLALIKRQFEADRYVLLGTSEDDRRIADTTDWEYIPIEEAATKAGWEVKTTGGFLARIARLLTNR